MVQHCALGVFDHKNQGYVCHTPGLWTKRDREEEGGRGGKEVNLFPGPQLSWLHNGRTRDIDVIQGITKIGKQSTEICSGIKYVLW